MRMDQLATKLTVILIINVLLIHVLQVSLKWVMRKMINLNMLNVVQAVTAAFIYQLRKRNVSHVIQIVKNVL